MEHEDDFVLIDRITEAATNKIREGTSIFELSETEQVAMMVNCAQGAVDNSGFYLFYDIPWPGTPAYSLFIEAFRKIGAEEVAKYFAETAALFPFENAHLDRERRLAFLDGLRDWSRFEMLGERVMDLHKDTMSKLADYIRKHQPAK